MIVETDLRNPSLAAQHGLAVGPGLAELLTHQVELEEAIQSKPIAAGGNGAGGGERALDVIVAGAIAVGRVGLCTRDTAAHLREQLARLEAPVLGIVANAVKLGRRGRYGYGYYGWGPRSGQARARARRLRGRARPGLPGSFGGAAGGFAPADCPKRLAGASCHSLSTDALPTRAPGDGMTG